MATMLAFLPDEIMLVIPLALGCLVMLRLLTVGRAMGILIALIAVLSVIPFLVGILDFLPVWALTAAMIFFAFSLISTLSSVLLGKGVSDYFLGSILHDLLLLPFRAVRWLIFIFLWRTRA